MTKYYIAISVCHCSPDAPHVHAIGWRSKKVMARLASLSVELSSMASCHSLNGSTCALNLILPLLELRYMYHSQLNQCEWMVNAPTGQAASTLRYKPRGICVLDLTQDEFGHCQVQLCGCTTRMIQWTSTECPLKLFNRMLQTPFIPVLSVTRESTVPLVCRVL